MNNIYTYGNKLLHHDNFVREVIKDLSQLVFYFDKGLRIMFVFE